MARQFRQVGRVLVVLLPLLILALLLLLPPQPAASAPFVNPFWTNVSPSPECPCSGTCCEGPGEWHGGVSARTNAFEHWEPLSSMPGHVEDNLYSILYRSDISGGSQFSNHWIAGYEVTVNQINATTILVNQPTGETWTYNNIGGSWVSASCNVTSTLVVVGGGTFAATGGAGGTTALAGGQTITFVLTDKFGNVKNFNAQGMPMSYVDRNGNTDTLVYGTNYQIQSITNERGGTTTFATTPNGYISAMTDPAGRTWSFSYDSADRLISITTPPSQDQPLGITRSFVYDKQGRLVTVTDGRSNLEKAITYVGTTLAVQAVTRYGFTTTYATQTGLTTRTDPNGNIHRTFWTGPTITSTDMLVQGQPKYVKLYRYNGTLLVNMVLPRGNRVDFTYDPMLNLTQKRLRETDTNQNLPTDQVHTWTYGANFKTSYTDPLGHTTTYGRDGVGNLLSVTHPQVTQPTVQSAQETFTYNPLGQRLTHTDADGLLTTYVYFSTGPNTGLLEKIQVGSPGGIIETSFGYDALFNVNARTDPNGATTLSTFDGLRRLVQSQAPQPLGYLRRSTYDANGNLLTSEVENRGKDLQLDPQNPWITRSMVYTPRNQVQSTTDEVDATTTRTTSFTHDSNGNRLSVTKPMGNVESWTYTERNQVLTHTVGTGDLKASTSSRAYDPNGNVVTVTNGRNLQTTFAFDLFDRRTRGNNALGVYAETTFDAGGNVIQVARYDAQDQQIQRIETTYDERGRPWHTAAMRQDPSGPLPDAVSTVHRTAAGLVTVVTDALGQSTSTEYDAWHRVSKRIDAMGDDVQNAYDPNGNLIAWQITETDGTSTVTHEYEATYDVLNRRITTTEIDRLNAQNRLVTTTAYDSRSERVWAVDAKGNPTRWTFDAAGRMVQRERALTLGQTTEDFLTAQVTGWAFDLNNRLVGHTDDGPNTSAWSHDALDRPVTMTYPDASSASMAYDANSNLVQLTQPSGTVVQDVFDALDRNTSRSVALGTGVGGTTAETRTYDALGRMITSSDDDYHLSYQYEVNGLGSLMSSETQSYVGSVTWAKTVTKSHDAVGRTQTEGYPSGTTLHRTWTPIGRLGTVSDGVTTLASFTYWGARPKGTTFQNGMTEARTYTGFRGEVQQVLHQTSAQSTVLQLDYAYDSNHDRLFERFGGAGSAGDAFAYDRLRRLTTAWMGSATPSNPATATYTKKIDYVMDDDGNRSSVVVTPWGGAAGSTPYTTNNLNQYTVVGTTTRQHDLNGNLKADGQFVYKYDYLNQLIEVRSATGNLLVASYLYDPAGRRVEKTVSATGSIERYIYSGLETVSVYDGANGWKQDFVFGDVIDQVLMLQQRDVLDYDGDQDTSEVVRHFYHRNASGSVMEITDPTQASAVSYRYDPYGKVTITRGGQVQATDPLGQPWMYTARFFDGETGLYYYRARTYDPVTGRFLQRDPLGYAVAPSAFLYAFSSPLTYRDAMGLGPDTVDHVTIIRKRPFFSRAEDKDSATHSYPHKDVTFSCIDHYRGGSAPMPGALPGDQPTGDHHCKEGRTVAPACVRITVRASWHVRTVDVHYSLNEPAKEGPLKQWAPRMYTISTSGGAGKAFFTKLSGLAWTASGALPFAPVPGARPASVVANIIAGSSSAIASFLPSGVTALHIETFEMYGPVRETWFSDTKESTYDSVSWEEIGRSKTDCSGCEGSCSGWFALFNGMSPEGEGDTPSGLPGG